MMSKIQTSLRLDEDKFSEAKVILKSLGLNFTDAVNIFTNMVGELTVKQENTFTYVILV